MTAATPPAPEAVFSPPARARRRLLGVAASMAIHAVLFGLLLLSLAGAIAGHSGGSGDDETGAVAVSLVGLRGGASSSADVDTQELKTILRQITAQSTISTAPAANPASHSDLKALLDQIDRTNQNNDVRPGDGGQSDQDQGGVGAPTRQGSAAAGKAAKASVGQALGLWAQLEPCWRQIPGSSAVPVMLEVRLDGRGLVTSPPIVLRPTVFEHDEQRRLAVARALAAITGCGPYKSLSGPGEDGSYRVTFTASR